MTRSHQPALLTLGCAAALTAFAGTASAQTVLLTDSFERTSGFPEIGAFGGLSDWGMNDNAAGGSSVQTYHVTATNLDNARQQHVTSDVYNFETEMFDPGTDGVGRLRFGATQINLDLTTLAPNGYSVRAQMERPLFGGFTGIGFGIDPVQFNSTVLNGQGVEVPFTAGGTNNPLAPANDFAFLMRPLATDGTSGQTQFLTTNVNGVDKDIVDNPFLLPSNVGFFDILLTVTPQVAGNYGSGALLDVTLQADNNPALTYNTTVTSDGVGVGYVSFFANNTNGGVDDLVVTALAAAGGIDGDYNNNGQVEQGDLDLVLLNWGQDGTTPPSGWTNNLPVGLIDQAELDGVLLNWGNTSEPAGSAVPEPAAAALLTLGALGMMRRRAA